MFLLSPLPLCHLFPFSVISVIFLLSLSFPCYLCHSRAIPVIALLFLLSFRCLPRLSAISVVSYPTSSFAHQNFSHDCYSLHSRDSQFSFTFLFFSLKSSCQIWPFTAFINNVSRTRKSVG
jgi:hypothetical protein